ncbi:hypothetical protein H045_06090 [Pseudomonas poae RE*1-1-14]|nr:hypothetical protein H045_06090 [Pseudomonas poae RE*1-1-14]
MPYQVTDFDLIEMIRFFSRGARFDKEIFLIRKQCLLCSHLKLGDRQCVIGSRHKPLIGHCIT